MATITGSGSCFTFQTSPTVTSAIAAVDRAADPELAVDGANCVTVR
ncbi:MAG: hypothetical protein ABI541_09605 [Betaproteobacteria bacterium]